MFADRESAGRKLAERAHLNSDETIVISASPGGRAVAAGFAEYSGGIVIGDADESAPIHHSLAERTFVVTDDGSASLDILKQRIDALRSRCKEPRDKIILALPISSTAILSRLHEYCDEIICLREVASENDLWRTFPSHSTLDEIALTAKLRALAPTSTTRGLLNAGI